MAKIQLLQRWEPISSSSSEQKKNVKTNVVKGHINKLLFVFPQGMKSHGSVMKHELHVRHISKRVTNLITGLNFLFFNDLSDEAFGSVMGQSADLRGLGDTYLKNGGEDPVLRDFFNGFMRNEKVSILVDLGSFMLDNGDELDITIDRFTYANYELPEMAIYSVSDEESESFNMLTYDVDYDQNELHRNVRRLYLQDSQNWVMNRNVDVYVDSPSDQYQFDTQGAMAYAMLMGKFENQNPEVFKIYENEVSEDVSVKLIGSEAGEVGIIAVRVFTNFEKYEEQQREVLLKKAKVVENLEKNEPEKASVLHASGVIPTSSELVNAAEEFKKL